MVKVKMVKIDFASVKIRHYNKYSIFIYSEQNDISENENDHFDHDHFDHVCLHGRKLLKGKVFPVNISMKSAYLRRYQGDEVYEIREHYC